MGKEILHRYERRRKMRREIKWNFHANVSTIKNEEKKLYLKGNCEYSPRIPASYTYAFLHGGTYIHLRIFFR